MNTAGVIHMEGKVKESELIDFMAWLLTNFMECCKCLFMGISGVSSFYPAPPKTVKCRKNGVKNGVCLWDVYQEFNLFLGAAN